MKLVKASVLALGLTLALAGCKKTDENAADNSVNAAAPEMAPPEANSVDMNAVDTNAADNDVANVDDNKNDTGPRG